MSHHSSEPWSLRVVEVDGRNDVEIHSACGAVVCCVGSLIGDETDRVTMADARMIEKAPVMRMMLEFAMGVYNSLLQKSSILNGQTNSIRECVSEIAEVLRYIETE